MYSRNLDTADEVIHRTRELLVAQKNAVRDYLNFITQEIREIYDLAEARYRVVKPIAYMQAIEAAENRIIHVLGERSQAYETLNLAALTPQQRKSRFSGLAKTCHSPRTKIGNFPDGVGCCRYEHVCLPASPPYPRGCRTRIPFAGRLTSLIPPVSLR